MPGEVTMDAQGAVGSQDLKKDRSHAQETMQSSNTPALQQSSANGDVLHGPNGILPDGTAVAEHSPATMNGSMKATDMPLAASQNPPQLDQSWRQHESYKSLGTVMERLAQKCYKDLNTTLAKMSEIEVEPQQAQTNGILPHTGEDTSEGSRRKKRLLMDFAKEQRDVFVKTFVLSDWSRNEVDQGKLIDVKVWQDKQREAQLNAIRAIGQTKVNMIPAKVPAPNIEGAMELLATGKASWTPDLGYIPSKRLTAKQLLRTLRNMNVVLATRLNLHENLPAHFSDFTIADGRATFVVKDEFEVDLAIADEDPISNFYFIDIRLLFKPAPQGLHDRLRGPLEAKVNQELATKGLKGCYDFLHNFVITHKINILRSQAVEMIRGKWVDCIKTDNMRRSFIVHYWAGMPGPKSWVEIGIGSGKKAAKVRRRSPTPEISVRWFRRGKEVVDDGLQLDWRDLDLEKSLTTVIGLHIEWILQDLSQRIRTIAGPGSPASIELTRFEDPTEAPAVVLKHPSLPVSLQVRIEAVTGRFSITPPSQSAAPVERHLNSTATVDVAKSITSLVCAIATARLHKEVELVGWTRTPNLTRQDNLQEVFGEVVRHFSVYTPGRAWHRNRALAITFSLAGEKFWAVSLDQKRDGSNNTTGRIISNARRVPLGNTSVVGQAVARADLLRIERLAVAEVAFGALAKQLRDMHIEFSFDTLTKSPANLEQDRAPNTAMFIRFSSLMKATNDKGFAPWAEELIRLTHSGVTTDADGQDGIRHDLRLTVGSEQTGILQKCLAKHQDRDLAMNSTGGLAIRLQTPFGEPFVQQMQSRLASVVRLDSWIAVLRKQSAKLTRVSLSRLEFVYNQAPQLGAQLSLSPDGSPPARLKFYPQESNPHQRIRVLLEQELNSDLQKGFEIFVNKLRFTFPVVRTFQRLETIDPAKRTLIVHPRASLWYTIKYTAPLQPCVLQLRAKKNVEGASVILLWSLALSNGQSLPEPFLTALGEIWRGEGEGWKGLKNGAEAKAQGVAALLERVDEVVRKFVVPEEVPTGVKAEEETHSTVNKGAVPQAVMQTQAQTNSRPHSQTKPQPPPRQAQVKKEPDVIMLD